MDGEAFPQRYEIASKDDLKTVVKFGWLKNFVYIILWSFVNMCRHTTAATAAAVAADHDPRSSGKKQILTLSCFKFYHSDHKKDL